MTLRESYLILKKELGEHEARVLIEHYLGFSRADVAARPETLVSKKDSDKLLKAVSRRKNSEPLQYIIGDWEFYGRNFSVGKGVLIPRQDTETLCDAAIDILPVGAVVIDLCSGSGCIPVAIKANRPDVNVYALEKFSEAFGFLKKNISDNGVEINAIMGDALLPAPSLLNRIPTLDMIVSNPPYLTKTEMSSLQKEVGFEPETALYGGKDGLDFYRAIAGVWKAKLAAGGILMFEIGAGQENEVYKILRENGFENVCHKRDLCGIIRVVYATKINRIN